VLGAGAGGLLVLAIWLFQQRRATQPLISVRHLLSPAVRLPYAMTFLAAVGICSALSAVTRFAQTPAATGAGYGWSAAKVSWYALPQLLGSLIAYAVIRALAARGRHVAALTTGIGLLILSFAVYGAGVTHATATLSALLIDSTGLAITLAVTQIVILRSVPAAESGVAVGLSVVLYAVGNSLGPAIAASLFQAYTVGGTTVPSLDRLPAVLPGLGSRGGGGAGTLRPAGPAGPSQSTRMIRTPRRWPVVTRSRTRPGAIGSAEVLTAASRKNGFPWRSDRRPVGHRPRDAGVEGRPASVEDVGEGPRWSRPRPGESAGDHVAGVPLHPPGLSRLGWCLPGCVGVWLRSDGRSSRIRRSAGHRSSSPERSRCRR
jgi:hypothetical protein